MARYRLHHSLSRRNVIRTLRRWARKYFDDSKRCRHQKISDAYLVALHLSRLVFKHPYPSVWWNILKDGRPNLPSYTQAFVRINNLLEKLQQAACPGRRCEEVLIDSMPLPVCRPKRAKRCRFAGAKWGYGTQGKFYGYKLHAWILPNGEIVHYSVKSANMHDITASYELNLQWPKYGGPRVIGDKGYCGLGYIYPPKKNTRYDTGWRDDYHAKMRKRIETVFSQLVAEGIRSVQAKTLRSLQVRVVLAVLAHNLTKP